MQEPCPRCPLRAMPYKEKSRKILKTGVPDARILTTPKKILPFFSMGYLNVVLMYMFSVLFNKTGGVAKIFYNFFSYIW
jgi:hypothetical protein